MAENQKLPILKLSNLWCAFCGSQEFIWDAYALRCRNCNSGISWEYDTDIPEFRYFFPETELFESGFKQGVKYEPDNAGTDHVYQFNPVPQWDIFTGHKLPDHKQIHELEKEIETHQSTIHKLQTRIKTLLSTKEKSSGS